MGWPGDELRCRMPGFVLSVSVQVKVMKHGIRAYFEEEVG